MKKTSSSRFASTSRIEGSISAYKELVEVAAEDFATHAGEGLKDARHLAGRKIQPSFAIANRCRSPKAIDHAPTGVGGAT